MARSHSGKKGKHGSTKPERAKKSWMKYSAKEVEQLIVKLAKSGKPSSQIGMILRDNYGIHDVRLVSGKKVMHFVNEHVKMELPEDLIYLIKKQNKILRHMEGNKHDQPSKIGLTLTQGKIMGLIKYYKKVGKLPKDWKYSAEQARLLTS